MAAETPMRCPQCGAEMKHHANKLIYTTGADATDSVLGGYIEEMHTCPACGASASRRAAPTVSKGA